jgi:hypothetical protein
MKFPVIYTRLICFTNKEFRGAIRDCAPYGNEGERRQGMPSKTKESRIEQKAYLEAKLKERLTLLAEQGADPRKAAKDKTVRKIRAELRATESRLSAIEGREKKLADMAEKKEEKSKTPKKEKSKKERVSDDQPEMSKRQKKKLEKQKEKAKQKDEETEG